MNHILFSLIGFFVASNSFGTIFNANDNKFDSNKFDLVQDAEYVLGDDIVDTTDEDKIIYFNDDVCSNTRGFILPFMLQCEQLFDYNISGSIWCDKNDASYSDGILNLSAFSNSVYSDLVLTVDTNRGVDILRLFVFTSNENQSFFSTQSYSDAKNKEKGFADYSVLTSYDFSLQNNTAYRKIVTIQNLNVYGQIKWTTDTGYSYSLRGVSICVSVPFSAYYFSAYTDSNGNYSTTITYLSYIIPSSFEPKIVLTINASTETSVIIDENSTQYSYSLSANYSNQSYINLSKTFDPNSGSESFFGKVFYLTQQEYHYSTYFASLTGQSMTNTFIRYSSNSDLYPSFMYYSNNNTLEIPYYTSSGPSFPSSYNAWDIFGHEYGHKIEHMFSLSVFHSLPHYIDWNLIDMFTTNPNGVLNGHPVTNPRVQGIEVAWSEGLATYLSLSAQHYFPSFLRNSIAFPFIDDGSYSGKTFVYHYNYDDSNWSSSVFAGEANENSVIAILFNLFDTDITFHDKHAYGDSLVWFCLTDSGATNLSDFFNYLYTDFGINKPNIALSLKVTSVIDDYITCSDTNLLTWTSNSGSALYPFNSFDLLFYSFQGNLIMSKTGLSATSYQLTIDDVDYLRDCTLNYFFVQVVYRCNYSFPSGPYYSTFHQFDI